MNEIIISARQTPGSVTFDNFVEVRNQLLSYVQNNFADVDYSQEGYTAAKEDRDELKKMRDVVKKKQKELKEAYSAPYVTVDKMLEELVAIIDEPYKKAKDFADEEEKYQKRRDILNYAIQKAMPLGDAGSKIINSPAFFKKDWLLKKYTVKKYQDEIDEVIHQAVSDIRSIQATGGNNTSALMAHFYETLSMDSVKNFQGVLASTQDTVDLSAVVSESNAIGYKVLKITATEDQMASIMDQLELMGVEVEELEDGMPKAMQEVTTPEFDSFVAFDIETTGTYGAVNGDQEAQITEIGAVRVENGVIVDRFDELANPGRDIVPWVARMTHITNEMVADKPPVGEVIRKFHEFVGDLPLVGHNIKSSDLRYIVKAVGKAGVHFDMPFLDTYLLAKKFKEKMHWEKINLGYLAQQYGFEHKEAHRAWSDAEVNAQVYFELKKLGEF